MNNKLENARNYTSRLDTKIGGGPGFNESLKLFSQSFHQRIQQRFLRNPKHWKPLSKTTKRIRSFLLNPNELLYLIMKWWNAGQKSGQISKKPSLSLRKPKLDPRMNERSPSLLRSGSLMRSIKIGFKRKDSKSKSNNGWVFQHLREISLHSIGAPYQQIQFFGGVSKAYVLRKKFKTKDGKDVEINIPIPTEFYTDIRLRMNQLKTAGYILESELVTVPPRNPLYFDNKDNKDLKNLLNRISMSIGKNFSGVLNAK